MDLSTDLAKFLLKLADVSQPLRDLATKNARFMWSLQHDRAFTEVSKASSKQPPSTKVLWLWQRRSHATVWCKWKITWCNAATKRTTCSFAFASRTLSPTERRHSQIEKECLTNVFGCQKFSKHITRSRQDRVRPQTTIANFQEVPSWSTLPPTKNDAETAEIQFGLGYKPGPQMYITDHLSRASMKDTGTPDKEFQVFALELEYQSIKYDKDQQRETSLQSYRKQIL